MLNKKRHLNVLINGDSDKIVNGVTCFSAHREYAVECQRTQCQHWISHQNSHNCTIIAAQNGPHTLQEIGKIYGLTRMRICQIEKKIYEKVKKSLADAR